jgi:hypothetical protein
MERNNYSYHNYNAEYYNQAHQENAQYGFQPGAGQTSGVSAGAPTANEQNAQFLAGFESYAQGAPLEECSTTLDFGRYATNHGQLTREGQAMCNNLSRDEVRYVAQALENRSNNYYGRSQSPEPVELSFAKGLEKYAQGVPLRDCSDTIDFRHYVSDTGRLTGRGRQLRSHMSGDGQQRVDRALASRHEKESKAPAYFLASLDRYAKGAPMEKCSKRISIDRYVTNDGYLKPEGEALYGHLNPEKRGRVDDALAARRMMTGNRSANLHQRELGSYHPAHSPRR